MNRIPASDGGPMLIGREEVLTIQLDPDAERPRRIELLLVERKLASPFNYKRNHARIVASVEADARTQAVELLVPAWLPDTYAGTTVGWDYEIRVVNDSLGLDRKDITPVVLSGGAPVDTGCDGFTDLQRSMPLQKAMPLGRQIGSQKIAGLGSIAVVWFLIGGLATGFGAVRGYTILLVFGLVMLAIMALVAINMLISKPLAVDDLVLELPDGVFRPGDVVEVRITSPIGQGLEIGLEAIEIYIDTGPNGKRGYRKTVIEHYMPLDRPVIRIPVLPTAPGGYAGEEVALHWVVAARQIGTKASRLPAETVRIPISRVF